MTTLAEIADHAAPHRLAILGTVDLTEADGLPPDLQGLVLLGPAEPGFWAHLTDQPEWRDSQPDPVDRWSRRVIGGLACDLGGKAYFPFGGPPYRPFYQWALRSGLAFASPVSLLVQKRAGLFASYRGAIALRQKLPPPDVTQSPCDTCDDKPCLSACPAGALTARGYDVPACHRFLDTEAGQDCLSRGCRVRGACPVSQAYGRVEEQSAYHMRLFHR